MDNSKRRRLIDRYRDCVHAVLVTTEHLSGEELDRAPATKGGMSARRIIHHLSDWELRESVQLRRMLAENSPMLLDWDQQSYAERLHYDRPIHASLSAFSAVALASIDLLEALNEDQWRRDGKLHRPWSISVENWLDEHVRLLWQRLAELLNAPTGGRAIPDP